MAKKHLTDGQLVNGMVIRHISEYDNKLIWITSILPCAGCKFNHYHAKRVGTTFSDAEYFPTCKDFFKANTTLK